MNCYQLEEIENTKASKIPGIVYSTPTPAPTKHQLIGEEVLVYFRNTQ